jgi:hypothetical protein
MALEKAVVPISFAGGIDTKTDDKQVLPGKLLLLENCKFQTAKKLRKVPGDVPLSRQILGSTSTITNGVSIAPFQEELVLNNGKNIYSYSPDDLAWSDKGPTFTVDLSTSAVIRNNFAQTTQDSATHSSGLQIFAWEDSSGGSRFSVIDSSNNLQVQSNVLISSSAQTPKCAALGNFLIVIYYEPTPHRLRMIAVPISMPTTFMGPTDLSTNIDSTNPVFDIDLIGLNVFVAFNTIGSGGITYFFVSPFLSSSAVQNQAGEQASVAISVYNDTSNNVWISYYNGTAVKTFIASYLLTTLILGPTVVETVANVRNVTGATLGTTATIFYEISAAITYNHFIRANTLTITGTVGTPYVVIRSVGLSSEAFSYQGNIFLLVAYEGPLQPTYFLINQTGLVALKLSPLTGGGLTKKSTLSQINPTAPNIYQLSYLQQDFFATTQGGNFFLTGVMQASIDFNPTGIISVDIGNGLQSTGGFLSSYDGISSVELGYHVFPEQVTVTPILSGGGMSPGSYQYSAVYAWTDNFGQIHRSAPSIPTTVVFSGGTPLTFTSTFAAGVSSIVVSSATGLFVGQTITDNTTSGNILAGTTITSIVGTTIGLSAPTQGASGSPDTLQTIDVYSATIVAPTLRVTAKQPPLRSNAWVELYRTQANQTIFYLVSSVQNPTYNNTMVDTVSFTDMQSDIAIQGNIQLYTTGGVIENISPPAPKLIWQYRTRLILVPVEADNTWWFSKEIVPGVPIEFTDSFVKNMDQRDGPITAGIQMDDKNVFFKGPTDIFYVTGEGPDSTGNNDDWALPQIVPTGAGCIDPFSVVLSPGGILYKSYKGIYLLNRALSASYIGAEVEAFNSAGITSSQLITDDNEIRFTLDNSNMLLYDYFFNQWSVIPQVDAMSSCNFQNNFCYVQSDGTVLQESPNIWTHNGNFRRIKLITSWLSVDGLQGFQRIYKMLVLGEYKSPHQLKCNVAINFNPNYVQESYINAGMLLANPAYGDDSPYGSGSPYGGVDQTYQWRLHMARQKCETIQLTLEEIPMLPYGEGLSLSAVSLEIGSRKGAMRLPASQSFG